MSVNQAFFLQMTKFLPTYFQANNLIFKLFNFYVKRIIFSRYMD